MYKSDKHIQRVIKCVTSSYLADCSGWTQTIWSCKGTEPAAELKYNLRYSCCFFAALVSRLGPLTLSRSCMFAVSLHKPGTIWWLALSASMAAFWSAGYRIRIKLCRMTLVSTMVAIVGGSCCIVVRRTCQRCARMPKAFSTTRRPLESIIEDSLLLCHLSLCIRFHHVRAKPKCVVSF